MRFFTNRAVPSSEGPVRSLEMHRRDTLTSLKTSLESHRTIYDKGVISHILEEEDNSLYAVIGRISDHAHISTIEEEQPLLVSGLDSNVSADEISDYYNNYVPINSMLTEGKDIEIPLAPLLIPITNPRRFPPGGLTYYIGLPVIVKLVEGIAVSAELVPKNTTLSLEEHKLYKRLVETSYVKEQKLDLVTLDQQYFFYTKKRLQDLGKLPINHTSRVPIHPVLVIENHATSDTITKQQNLENRVIIKTSKYLKGNNKAEKLKTALCHQPAKFFTGK